MVCRNYCRYERRFSRYEKESNKTGIYDVKVVGIVDWEHTGTEVKDRKIERLEAMFLLVYS